MPRFMTSQRVPLAGSPATFTEPKTSPASATNDPSAQSFRPGASFPSPVLVSKISQSTARFLVVSLRMHRLEERHHARALGGANTLTPATTASPDTPTTTFQAHALRLRLTATLRSLQALAPARLPIGALEPRIPRPRRKARAHPKRGHPPSTRNLRELRAWNFARPIMSPQAPACPGCQRSPPSCCRQSRSWPAAQQCPRRQSHVERSFLGSLRVKARDPLCPARRMEGHDYGPIRCFMQIPRTSTHALSPHWVT